MQHVNISISAMMASSAMSNNPPVVIPASGNNIIISPLQRGNPVLESIRNVGKEFGDIVADYQVGRTTGVLFLSLKYHRLHPEYIHTRIEKLGMSYNLRILLILCDISEHREPLRELTKACLINNITIMVAFSFDEAGHYLMTYKQFEFKSPDLIKERTEKDYNAVLRTTLTTISKVNKTDVETLRTSFGSFANISRATTDQLQNLPGFGHIKVKNIKNAFDKPFRNQATSLLSLSQSQRTASKNLPSLNPHSVPHMRPLQTELSPVWDIELDNSPSVEEAAGLSNNRPTPGDDSNVFDIDLNLN